MRRAIVLCLLVALALPGVALAHATVLATWPEYRQRLDRAPAQVRVTFDQLVRVFPDSIEVRTEDGRLVSRTARRAADAHTMMVPLGRLERGAYTVRWRALSADGHTVAGVWTFGVGVAAPPPTEAHGASGPTRAEHVVRWAYFLALALLIGGLGFRLLIVRDLPAAAERRFYQLTGLGVVATLEVGILAFILRAADALQLPFGELLYGNLDPIARGTRIGTAFLAMTLGFALVSALLFLAWLLERRVLLWAAFVTSLAFASGLSLSGHSAADAGSSWKSQLADWVHLSAACLWLGGLLQLAVVVWPLAPDARREAFLRFSRVAGVLVAMIVIAGVYLSILRLPEVSDLWQESYGRVLLLKLGLVSLALAWGAAHHFIARPLVERGDRRVFRPLSRSLLGEAAVGMAVLLAAAVLVDSSPPPPEPVPAQVVTVSP
jgi:copper transport protein